MSRSGRIGLVALTACWAWLPAAAWAQVAPTFEGAVHAGQWAIAGAILGLVIGALLGITRTASGMEIEALTAAGGLFGGLLGGTVGGMLGWGLAWYSESSQAETLLGLAGIFLGGLFGGGVTRRHFKKVSRLIKDVEDGVVPPPPIEYTDEELEQADINPPGPPPRPGL